MLFIVDKITRLIVIIFKLPGHTVRSKGFRPQVATHNVAKVFMVNRENDYIEVQKKNRTNDQNIVFENI